MTTQLQFIIIIIIIIITIIKQQYSKYTRQLTKFL